MYRCDVNPHKSGQSLTEQLRETTESLTASPGSAPSWGAQCFSEMTRSKLTFWLLAHTRRCAERCWRTLGAGEGVKQLTKLTRRSLEKTNPAGEGRKRKENPKTFICQQERGGERDHPSSQRRQPLPSSAWTRPLSRRMRADSSDRLGFAASSLDRNERCWHRIPDVDDWQPWTAVIPLQRPLVRVNSLLLLFFILEQLLNAQSHYHWYLCLWKQTNKETPPLQYQL